ncbi:MAG: hypothetical protein K9H84_07510 [Bacteroidales bacterium]|nr:hypothetical protein [Bacteroidales bacterium]
MKQKIYILLKGKILNVIISLFSFGLIIITGCDANFPDCDDCTVYVPEEGKVLIDFTINDENPEVVFFVYESEEAGKDTVFSDTSSSETYTLFLQTETHYTFEAIYYEGHKEIHTFDGGQIKVEEMECDNDPCYYAKVLEPDMRLLQQ